MAGRPRNITNEIRALELRSEGRSQREVAQELGVSTRTVARYEARWRRGDRRLPEVLAALWTAYDAEQHAWRRVQLLQALNKAAVAQAEQETARVICNSLGATSEAITEPKKSVKFRPTSNTNPDQAAAARDLLQQATARRTG